MSPEEKTLTSLHILMESLASKAALHGNVATSSFFLLTGALADIKSPLQEKTLQDHWRLFSRLWVMTSPDEDAASLAGANLGRLLDLGFNPWVEDSRSSRSTTFAAQFLSMGNVYNAGLPFFERLWTMAPEDWKTSEVWQAHLLGNALEHSQLAFADWLLGHGASIHGTAKMEKPPLFRVTTPAALTWALDHGADVTRVNPNGQQASVAWPPHASAALLDVLSTHPVTRDMPGFRQMLAFDGFVRYLKSHHPTLDQLVRQLKKQDLKVTACREGERGQSLVAASAIACLDDASLAWLRHLLSRKINLAHESIPGLPDALIVSLVCQVLGSVSYSREGRQVEWMRERIAKEPALLAFFSTQEKGLAALDALLAMPLLVDGKGPRLWDSTVGVMSHVERCTWAAGGAWLELPEEKSGSRGWALLGRTGVSYRTGEFSFETLRALSRRLPLTEWPVPTPHAMTRILNRLMKTPADALARPVAALSSLLDVLDRHAVEPDWKSLEKVHAEFVGQHPVHVRLETFVSRLRLDNLTRPDFHQPVAAPRRLRL